MNGLAAVPDPEGPPATETLSAPSPTEVRLVGGQSILHKGLKLLLENCGVHVVEQCEAESDLRIALSHRSGSTAKVVVLVLTGTGPFQAFRRIRDMMDGRDDALPLVIVSDKVSRGHVYTALRSGASAYVDLDAGVEELVTAIRKAQGGKVYLSAEAAELVASDISTSGAGGQEGKLPKIELSDREVEIVQLLCEGHISRDIGQHLHISAKTVDRHRENIMSKLDIHNRVDLVKYAISRGIIDST